MKIPAPVRKLKRRLLDVKVRPYVPRFSDDCLIMALRQSLQSASRTSGQHDQRLPRPTLTCCEDVVAHFQRRTTPSFFADRDTLAALVRAMATRHPAWRDRLLATVAADRVDGLRIYSTVGTPLRPGFPWAGMRRDPNRDDLYSTRPHRFGFAPRHALAILHGGEAPVALAEVLEDWTAFAARGRSELPYCSVLVVIQRVLSLSWTLAFAMAVPEPNEPDNVRLHAVILRILKADIDFLLPRLGKSAPNNHLLADRFAFWYIRLLFPEFVPDTVDIATCNAMWLAELDRQVYPDGTGFEHSVHYHEFGCEMAAAYMLLSRRNGRPVPSETTECIRRMLDFQVGLAGPCSITMPFGDGIEDPLFALDCGDGWFTAGLRELYRALFKPGLSPASMDIPSVERAFWLLGGTLAPPAPDQFDGEDEPRVWVDGGYAVLPFSRDAGRLIFRVGPAVHREVIAGHMHADLLSVCVTHEDKPVLVEPGTWCYRWRAGGTGPSRAYFAGPAAHNGLTLDAVDPLGVVKGDFRNGAIPIRVRLTRCLLGDGIRWLEAEVRGGTPYAGYRRGVVQVTDAYWIIYDCLPPGMGGHSAVLSFQTAVGVTTRQDANGTVWLETSAGSLWLAKGSGLEEPRISKGATSPSAGWLAPTYGVLVPANQIRYVVASGTAVTAFVLGVGTTAVRPTALHVLDAGLVIRLEGADTRDLLMLAAHNGGIAVDGPAGHRTASAVWTHSRSGRRESLRGLGSCNTTEQQATSLHQVDAPAAGATCSETAGCCDLKCQGLEGASLTLSGKVWD